jgi:hypothetical protein
MVICTSFHKTGSRASRENAVAELGTAQIMGSLTSLGHSPLAKPLECKLSWVRHGGLVHSQEGWMCEGWAREQEGGQHPWVFLGHPGCLTISSGPIVRLGQETRAYLPQRSRQPWEQEAASFLGSCGYQGSLHVWMYGNVECLGCKTREYILGQVKVSFLGTGYSNHTFYFCLLML